MDKADAIKRYIGLKESYLDFCREEHELNAEVGDDFKKYTETAKQLGFVLYDAWPQKPDPKVVFILDPEHNCYEDEIASLVRGLVEKRLLSDKDCLLFEGTSGVVDYDFQAHTENGKFYFGLKENGQIKCVSHPSQGHFCKLYETLKGNGMHVEFDDNIKLCHEIGSLSSRVETLNRMIKKGNAAEAANTQIEEDIHKMMQHMLTRSNNCFARGIARNLNKPHVLQIFGFYDYTLGNIQNRLQESNIPYAAFMPGKFKRK